MRKLAALSSAALTAIVVWQLIIGGAEGVFLSGGFFGRIAAQAATFLGLTDTPSSYSGAGLDLVRVNSGATALEFVDVSQLAYTPGGGIAASTIATAIAEVDSEAEKLANKNATSGYAGLSGGKVAYTQLGSYAAHSPLAAANSITVSARQMGIEGSGAPVDLTSDPQIVDGANGDEVTFIGLHATNTVQLDNGTGIRLCGNTGSVIVGLNGAKPSFRFNSTLDAWEQLECASLQAAANVVKTIYGVSDENSSLRVGTDANTHLRIFGNTIKAIDSGAAVANTTIQNPILQSNGSKPTCDTAISGSERAPVWVDSGGAGVADTLEWCSKDASDVYAWRNIGSATVADRSVSVYRTATQAISDITETAIQFTHEVFDTDTMHDTGANTTRLTFTTGGKYWISCQLEFQTNSTGSRSGYLRKNGTTQLAMDRRMAVSSDPTSVNPSRFATFAPGDYVELLVWHDAGTALNVLVTADSSPVCEAFQRY